MDIQIFTGFDHVLLEVSQALAPLVVLFLIFQFAFLKLEREQIYRIIIGLILTFFGLAFFLQGVYVGFLPAGREMGTVLGGFEKLWIIIPIGFVLGFVATIAEPAVRVLSYEVEKTSSGYIKEMVILLTLALGVGVFVALGMAKIIYGIPFYYIIIPGYLIVLLMLKFSAPEFTAIAFDSGGVATGPMTVTFIMAMAIGIADTMPGRDAVIDGFGLIALVALAPIIAVMALGLLYKDKEEL
ncbi:Protein of unknown function DUF1538 [Candidatus Syntrophocurvum alkaliphilum]|uniref:DUF1538 domain-containing protein n=1 Tax=Candidatus Syntrophocurvum alkaliphilum TaxID=2293317 RepID=A0A6I6DCZ2_9FIRM|nr:DUF1538 domain-containing protein [Candidatus Syntrophocurvum alkaliphilum]QGT98732.1 Protein of unknown function DUF1538 [Candidatus Syntrophocurvum alkaliphilum]